MADPLSIAASAVAFLSLAAQLADGVLKLKDVCTTINNAPEDLSSLCSQMDLLRSLLEEAGHQIQLLPSNDVDKAIVAEVFAQCEKARYKIAVRVTELSTRISRNKATTVKWAFKKKEIREMLSCMEQCRTDLIIARQTFESNISYRRFEALTDGNTLNLRNQTQLLAQVARMSQQINATTKTSANEFRSIREVHCESSSRICESIRSLKDQFALQTKADCPPDIVARIEDIQCDILASNSRLEHLVSERMAVFDGAHAHMVTRKAKTLGIAFQSVLFNFTVNISSKYEEHDGTGGTKGKPITKTICTIRLPRWFVCDQYYLIIKRAKNGWLFCPTMYRAVDTNCPFFEACRHGDLDTIKMLLSTKQAFISDRYQGHQVSNTTYSALNFAIEHRQVDVCKLLVNAGILNQFQTADYEATLAWFFWTRTSSRSNDLEILRLIEPRRDSNGDFIDDVDLLSCAHRAISDLSHSVVESGESRLTRFEASVFASTFSFAPCSGDDAESTVAMLSKFLDDPDCVADIHSARSNCSWLLFALASDLAAASFSWDERRDEVSKLTLSIYTQLCSVGIDLHASLGDLPKDWQDLFVLVSLVRGSGHWTMEVHDWIREASFTPFLILMLPVLRAPYAHASEVMQLWVLTLHNAGVDLENYADKEVWRLERALRKVAMMGTHVYGISHGPDPNDWDIWKSPLGEVDPVYFWRGQVEYDIEQETAEAFYRSWDLATVVQEWSAVFAQGYRTVNFSA